MSRVFLSHSSINNAEAVAIRDWLAAEGWNEVFLDLDSGRGIAAGERWERALNQAASRCEAVLFLISQSWLDSRWCMKEFNLARKLNKRLFGVLIEVIPVEKLPADLTGAWQVVDLASGQDHAMFHVVLPRTHEEAHLTFSKEGLMRLRNGLAKAGLDPRFFAWPPERDPDRPPYRGLKPLEAEDAGIFFGRDAPIVEALDTLRGLREGAAPRLLVILGASGAGKSSFLRAGLLPRVARDDRNFLPLPVIRPERAAITGEAGFLNAIETALTVHGLAQARANLREAVADGAEKVRPLLAQLVDKVFTTMLADETEAQRPSIVFAIDQAEELFVGGGADEGQRLLDLIRALVTDDQPSVIALFTIRSDSYDRLETAKQLEGIRQRTLPLLPMPRGAYQAVIEGPTERLRDTPRAVTIDPALTQALLADIESGGGRDALPLLAFTLERLYLEYRGRGRLRLADYDALGRIKGSIEAAIERVMAAADTDPKIPRDRHARLLLLRRGLIPWLAGIDPETGSPRRRIARLSEIPQEARPLIQYLVDERLLRTDVAQDTREGTIEPTHEALLRQWGLLEGWLAEDAGLLGVLEGVKRASRDWSANARDSAWLTHATSRLAAAERLRERADLAKSLEPTDWDYLAACRKRERAALIQKRRVQAAVAVLLAGTVVGFLYAAWSNRFYLKVRISDFANVVRPEVLTSSAEAALKPNDFFKECANCPTMVVLPTDEFTMGSPAGETGRREDENPQHKVTITTNFAVGQFEVTFDEWDACVVLGGCLYQPPDQKKWGRGNRPVINVSWDDAQRYLAWLVKRTSKSYRLLSEAEWEYAARAGSDKAYAWGDQIGVGKANCDGCGSRWDDQQTAPVGSFLPNAFGLYDMHGNVQEWVEDCYHANYEAAPQDGSAWTLNCADNRRVLRGGSWYGSPTRDLRSASRLPLSADFQGNHNGFRVGRVLQR